MTKIATKLKTLHATPIGKLIEGVVSNSASETLQKVSRVAAIVVIARVMEAEAIGLAAVAIAIGDIVKAMTENGVVQRVISAKDEDLRDVTATAHRIFWLWSLGLMAAQFVLAGGYYVYTGDALIPMLIAVMALEYLFMPAGLVQCALAMRAGKMTGVATIAGGQIVMGNLLSALLVFIWPVALMLVLPRVLTAPLWLLGMRRLHPWRKDKAAVIQPFGPFMRFGGFVLSTEVLKTLRLQADKLLIGALLGAEALGIYFFAFNAGLGIATSFSTAFARVVYPFICAAEDRKSAMRQGIGIAVLVVSPVVVIQALAVPYYVPIIFGEKWANITDIVQILVLAAIPSVIWSAASQYMRAQDKPEQELWVTAALAIAVFVATWVLAPYGLAAIAWGYLIISSVIQLGVVAPMLFTPKMKRSLA